jgi:hypothetical protein
MIVCQQFFDTIHQLIWMQFVGCSIVVLPLEVGQFGVPSLHNSFNCLNDLVKSNAVPIDFCHHLVLNFIEGVDLFDSGFQLVHFGDDALGVHG